MVQSLATSITGLRSQASEADELPTLLASAAATVSRALATEWVAVIEVIEAGHTYLVRTHRPSGADSSGPVSFEPGRARELLDHLLGLPGEVVVGDTQTDRRFDCGDFREAGITSVAGVRIAGRDGAFGLLLAYSTDHAFTQMDGWYIREVAGVLGEAVARVLRQPGDEDDVEPVMSPPWRLRLRERRERRAGTAQPVAAPRRAIGAA